MEIDVDLQLHACIQGRAILTAPSVEEVHDLLGPPSRIVDAGGPAPVGHRNNQVHVYDSDGFFFNEHHFTRRMMGMTIVLWRAEHWHLFTPTKDFSGQFRIAGFEVTPLLRAEEFLKGCPVRLKMGLAGQYSTQSDDRSLHISTKGARLPSGKRSKQHRIVCIAIGWPHDPWQNCKTV